MDTYPPPSTKQDERGTVLHSLIYFYFEVLFKVDVLSIRAKVPFLK